jgi:hypothetical protein
LENLKRESSSSEAHPLLNRYHFTSSITSLATEAAILLVLGRTDFQGSSENRICGKIFRTPADCFTEQRKAGLL